jgi:hypothetical protein
LISPKDEALIAMRLRDHGDRASHVRRMTIPVLGEPRKARGFLSGLMGHRGNRAPHQGCDPDAFAAEIGLYLEQALARRGERSLKPPAPPVQPTPSALPDERGLEDLLVGVVVKPTLEDSSFGDEPAGSQPLDPAPAFDPDRDVVESRAEQHDESIPTTRPSTRLGLLWSPAAAFFSGR